MNKIKTTVVLLTVMVAASAFTLTAGAADLEESPQDEFGVFTVIAGEGTTYVNLFDAILADDYARMVELQTESGNWAIEQNQIISNIMDNISTGDVITPPIFGKFHDQMSIGFHHAE